MRACRHAPTPLAAYAAPVVEGAQAHAFCVSEIIHLRMTLESFTTSWSLFTGDHAVCAAAGVPSHFIMFDNPPSREHFQYSHCLSYSHPSSFTSSSHYAHADFIQPTGCGRWRHVAAPPSMVVK